jgi:hypothetical protein
MIGLAVPPTLVPDSIKCAHDITLNDQVQKTSLVSSVKAQTKMAKLANMVKGNKLPKLGNPTKATSQPTQMTKCTQRTIYIKKHQSTTCSVDSCFNSVIELCLRQITFNTCTSTCDDDNSSQEILSCNKTSEVEMFSFKIVTTAIYCQN